MQGINQPSAVFSEIHKNGSKAIKKRYNPTRTKKEKKERIDQSIRNNTFLYNERTKGILFPSMMEQGTGFMHIVKTATKPEKNICNSS